MNLTWLGQGGFLVEHANRRLVIDPYFSNALASLQGLRRLVPPPMTIAELKPDYVFITHNHLDHFDPETLEPLLLDSSPESLLIGPKSVIGHGRKLGIKEKRFREVSIGHPITLPDFQLTPTPARHSDPHAVGLLLETDQRLIYLSGDTLFDPQLAQQIKQLATRPIDVAMVCINGRLGNMDQTEAAHLAANLKPAVTIPMHYGMFAENTADPNKFVAACEKRDQKTRLLENGETFTLR